MSVRYPAAIPHDAETDNLAALTPAYPAGYDGQSGQV